ncbi:MAG: type II toxin-antitoxin system VapC family toxin [Wenzhouxiangellaceae bacterium]|nr:type II toxin-antitoxin system VapC family toxin [Wenzhouxiangellaceae bacterium]
MNGVLLDTNVVSELMRPNPSGRVLSWFAEQSDAAFFVSAITRAEIFLGIALLPEGRRRDRIARAAEGMLNEDFARRCLAFDARCADEYALIVAARTRTGRPVTTEDAQIAATAICHDMPLATRNLRDFEHIAGLKLLDPWA